MRASGDLVRRVRFLAGLDDDDVAALLESSRTVSYPRGSIVFHEGDSADVLYVLLRGSAKVVLEGEGGQQIMLSEIQPGGVLGEMALFDEAPRSATAVTLQPTEFLQIRRREFLALLDRRPGVARDLLSHAVGLLRDANEPSAACRCSMCTAASCAA